MLEGILKKISPEMALGGVSKLLKEREMWGMTLHLNSEGKCEFIYHEKETVCIEKTEFEQLKELAKKGARI